MKYIALLSMPLIFGLTPPALGFRTASDLQDFAASSRVRWTTAHVEYLIQQDGAPGILFGDLQATAETELRRWSTPDCTGVSLDYQGTTAEPAAPDDGINTIQWLSADWAERGFDPAAGGLTDVNYQRNAAGNWQIVEADLYVNADNFDWVVRGQPPEGKRELASLLLHESGHMLGLLHPCELMGADGAPDCAATPEFDEAAMNPVYAAGRVELSTDDKAGICYLYPTPGCEEMTCAEGEFCKDGTCYPDCKGQACSAGEVCTANGCAASACEGDGCRTVACDSQVPCLDGATCHDGVCGQEGETGREFGASCSTAEECADGKCVARESAEMGVCSRSCGADLPACPAQSLCREVDGETACLPTQAIAATGGCNLVTSPESSIFGAVPMLTCLGLFRVGRRRAAILSARHRRRLFWSRFGRAKEIRQ
jgi:hypothetical protein